MSSKNAPPLRGLFVTLEGTEGAGKSTLAIELTAQLEALRIPVLKTREPGGTPLAELVRGWVLEHPMHARTETLLYAAARAEHVATKIQPALDAGTWVICDRFTDSTLAYQGQARGLPWKDLTFLNQFATSQLKPDLTLFLSLPPALGLQRAQDKNRFEAEGLAWHEQVHKGFLKAQRADPQRWLQLDSEHLSCVQLSEIVMKHLEKIFGNRYPALQRV